jgi:hypothetical protein
MELKLRLYRINHGDEYEVHLVKEYKDGFDETFTIGCGSTPSEAFSCAADLAKWILKDGISGAKKAAKARFNGITR